MKICGTCQSSLPDGDPCERVPYQMLVTALAVCPRGCSFVGIVVLSTVRTSDPISTINSSNNGSLTLVPTTEPSRLLNCNGSVQVLRTSKNVDDILKDFFQRRTSADVDVDPKMKK